MNSTPTIFDLIESYLADKLSTQERADFETRLHNDTEFAADVQLHMEARHALTLANESELKHRLDTLGRKLLSENQRTSRSIAYYAVRMAAVVSLFALSYVAYVYWFSGQNTTDLYAANYTPPSALTFRSASTDIDPILVQAQNSYAAKDYTQAIDYMETYIGEQIGKPATDRLGIAWFYKGICHMQQSEWVKAQASLKQSTQQSHIYLTQAQWYKALVCIKLENVPCAREILEVLAKDKQGDYYEKAQKLLNQLP